MRMAASGASPHTLIIIYPYREHKLKERTQIYIQRGLNAELANEVAVQLTANHAREAHARDEIGIHENTPANPLQATGSSTLAFSVGALFLIFSILIIPEHYVSSVVMIVGISSLAL